MTATVNLPVEQAVARVKEALKTEGFGIITEIDVQRTFSEKLGAQMEPYVILGACNPPLAHRALQAELQIGLLLPCNVVVRESPEGCLVEEVDPDAMLGLVSNEAVATVAHEANARLCSSRGRLAASREVGTTGRVEAANTCDLPTADRWCLPSAPRRSRPHGSLMDVGRSQVHVRDDTRPAQPQVAVGSHTRSGDRYDLCQSWRCHQNGGSDRLVQTDKPGWAYYPP